ncbi:MAG: NAD(P)H-hydrate dehydratase [Elainellaceae cyanobacterium]
MPLSTASTLPLADCQYRQRLVVSAAEMQAIESRVFDAGMPVAALMEKVAGQIAERIVTQYPQPCAILVVAGPGHNGGDALVVARELHHRGYSFCVCSPFAGKLSGQKTLTGQHARYAKSVGIPFIALEDVASQSPAVVIDGLFGFGLSRPIEGDLAQLVGDINALDAPVISIDLPSGIHTDSGSPLGEAIYASHTLCLGLWKRACLQEQALAYLGDVSLVDFDIPVAAIEAVLGQPQLVRITPDAVAAALPLQRSPTTYKYREGHLLLVCGSESYLGAALLAGLAARASGVGMLTIAVPQALKPLLAMQIPDAITVGCPTEAGAIAAFPDGFDLSAYSAIACGPGLTQRNKIVPAVVAAPVPLLLDADGLNQLAKMDVATTLSQRNTYTVLTPHAGEFKRLFPDLGGEQMDPIARAQQAAQRSRSTIVLKGACTVISAPNGNTWLNPHSTPALARGGSGDVLTGLVGGLMAQLTARGNPIENAPWSGAWWHAQAALALAQDRGVLGVDAHQLAMQLVPQLALFLRGQR